MKTKHTPGNYEFIRSTTRGNWNGICKIVGLRDGVIEVSAKNFKTGESALVQSGSTVFLKGIEAIQKATS